MVATYYFKLLIENAAVIGQNGRNGGGTGDTLSLEVVYVHCTVQYLEAHYFCQPPSTMILLHSLYLCEVSDTIQDCTVKNRL